MCQDFFHQNAKIEGFLIFLCFSTLVIIFNTCLYDEGTLINRRYILTAAHCQNNPLPIEQAVVGEHILGRDPDCEQGCAPNQVFQVGQEDVIVHPEWDRNKNPINDIALIRLQKPGKLTSKQALYSVQIY